MYRPASYPKHTIEESNQSDPKNIHYYDEWEGQKSFGMEIIEDDWWEQTVRYQNDTQSFRLKFKLKKKNRIGFI